MAQHLINGTAYVLRDAVGYKTMLETRIAQADIIIKAQAVAKYGDGWQDAARQQGEIAVGVIKLWLLEPQLSAEQIADLPEPVIKQLLQHIGATVRASNEVAEESPLG